MNSDIKFDPMTGKPINNNQNNEGNNKNEAIELQQNINSIATVDQSNEKFINNIQSDSKNIKKESKEKTSYIFLIILFIIIFAAIFFLFPLINSHM